MRYPYERFLNFLVSRKVDIRQAEIRYGLPAAGGMWVAECKSRIRNTAPHAITHYLKSDSEQLTFHDGVLEWAEEGGFRELWEIQQEFGNGKTPADLDLAFRIFVNPGARAILGLLLLSRATENEIIELVQERFDLGIDSDALAIYRRIFWDTRVMGRSEWTGFIDELRTKEERHYLSFSLASPSYEEIRHILGLDLVLDPGYVLGQIMSNAFMMHKMAMAEPRPEDSGAMKWAELTLKAVNTMNGRKKIDAELGGEIPKDFNAMFSVKISKSSHVSLTDIKGQLGAPEKAVPSTDEE